MSEAPSEDASDVRAALLLMNQEALVAKVLELQATVAKLRAA